MLHGLIAERSRDPGKDNMDIDKAKGSFIGQKEYRMYFAVVGRPERMIYGRSPVFLSCRMVHPIRSGHIFVRARAAFFFILSVLSAIS